MTSDRITYQLIDAPDLQELHDLNMIPEVDQYNTMGIPNDISVTRQQLEEKINDHQQHPVTKLTYTMRLKSDASFIGICGILFSPTKYKKAELWLKQNPLYWNKGYATEAVKLLLKQCFETYQLHRVEAGCAVANVASKKVLEKCGFTQEGIQRKNLPLKTGWSDNYEFGMLEEEYFTNQH